MSCVLLRWKHLDFVKAFERWQQVLHEQKEQNRMLQYAEYEFRQKALSKAVCVWIHSANIRRFYERLQAAHTEKTMHRFFDLWQSEYRNSRLMQKYEEMAVL